MSLKKIGFGVMCSLLLMVNSANVALASGPDSTLVKIYLLAGKGQILNSAPFGLGTKIADIKKGWGEPDNEMLEMLFAYAKQDVIFVTMDPNPSQEGDYKTDSVTAMMPLAEGVEGTPLAKLVKDLGDPTHKEILDSNSMTVCYDINGNHLRFTLARHSEESSYVVLSYMVSKVFNMQL